MTVDPERSERPSEAASPSVLRRPGSRIPEASPWAPTTRADLNLDQVLAAVTAESGAYDLLPLFHAPLRDPADVAYRHAVFRDLADPALREAVEAFAESMRRGRQRVRRAATLRQPRQAQRLRLDAASSYCDAVRGLASDLERHAPRSQALGDVAAHVGTLAGSRGFRELCDEVERLERDLGLVTYRLTLLEDRVHVGRAAAQRDYGADLERTFAAFGHRPAVPASAGREDRTDMNTVEAAILERVARLHPEVFARLQAFAARHTSFVDRTVEAFEREVQFYLAYLAYAERFEAAGLPFCLPEVTSDGKRVHALQAFDLALADRLLRDGEAVVTNGFELDGRERILVVTGANQGGKSTFARMFGQLHYLAALGCPVPGREARLVLCDELLTHFDRDETLRTLQGKLQEELSRLQRLLERTTAESVVVMNEAFSSTAKDDALALGRATLERLLERDVVGVYVTFVDELASCDERVVSVTATVRPDDPSRRTFEILRRPADGRAHALAMAEGYGLTYRSLRRRLGA